jgi:hypothetical protein
VGVRSTCEISRSASPIDHTRGVTSLKKEYLPVVIPGSPIPGAHGSLRATEWVIVNAGTTELSADFWFYCPPDACPPPLRLAPGAFAKPHYVARHPWGDGAFVEITGGRPAMHLRVQDLSRQALTWGTEVPIVDENDVIPGRVDLAGVPAESDFRPMLRIYDFDGTPESLVRLRIFDEETNEVLVDEEVRLISPHSAFPGFASFSAFPELPEGHVFVSGSIQRRRSCASGHSSRSRTTRRST